MSSPKAARRGSIYFTGDETEQQAWYTDAAHDSEELAFWPTTRNQHIRQEPDGFLCPVERCQRCGEEMPWQLHEEWWCHECRPIVKRLQESRFLSMVQVARLGEWDPPEFELLRLLPGTYRSLAHWNTVSWHHASPSAYVSKPRGGTLTYISKGKYRRG